jgi:hypothetical protein
MQIRVGGYYRSWRGEVYGPIQRSSSDVHFPWHCKYDRWTDDGKYNLGGNAPSDCDLISEVYVSDTPPDDAPAPETKTLRDEFAIAIVMALLSKPLSDNDLTPERCKIVWDNATAMMEARKK